MYLELTIIALAILFYSVISGRIDNLPVTGPIIFVLFGIVAGPLVTDVFKTNLEVEFLRTLAELALALVLFTDASKTNLRKLEHNVKLPVRLLLVGLPLTIIAGTISGYFIFSGLTWIELAIIATMLAPTDAALGKAVVTNSKVPSNIREALNVESGLNDGISVPVLFLLIALSEASEISDVSVQFGMGLFLREIGIGVLVGLCMTFLGDRLIQFGVRHKYVVDSWKPIIIMALAFSIFSLAQLLRGSGFIACFVGGVLYGSISKERKGELLLAAEGAADTLSLVTWFLFGSVALVSYHSYLSWEVLLYALLSLTVVRIIPVLISLNRSETSLKQKLFMGWFGPRGLASIVFAIMVLDIQLPHRETIVLTVVCTILLSVMAHGFTANSLVNRLVKSSQNTKT